MLSDLERKVLTIIRNTNMRLGRPPSIKDLMVRTGRSEKDLHDVLERLTEQKYIEWSRESPGEFHLLKAWERKKEF